MIKLKKNFVGGKMQEKVNILNLNMEELEKFVLELGMKKFNAKQIFKWLHSKIARTFDDMTDISQDNRVKLYENSYIPYLELLKHQVSKIDKTEKYLFQLADKHTIIKDFVFRNAYKFRDETLAHRGKQRSPEE